MSREAFEARIEREMPAGTVISNPKWWADRLWEWSQHTAQQWIPYKEGDVVEDGWYLVTYKGSSGIAEMTSGVWYFIDANLRLYQHHVTAYRPLPAPYRGES